MRRINLSTNYTNNTKKKILNTELHRGKEEFHRVLREKKEEL